MTCHPKDDIVVRPAEPADEDALRRLCTAYDCGTAEVSLEKFRRRFRTMIERDDYCLVLAVLDGRAVGYALAQDYGPGLRAQFTTGRVHDVYVAPDSRRSGVGSRLMDRVCAWARARSEPMILDWRASPAAVQFYASLGFEPDRVGDFARFPGFSLDLRTTS